MNVMTGSSKVRPCQAQTKVLFLHEAVDMHGKYKVSAEVLQIWKLNIFYKFLCIGPL